MGVDLARPRAPACQPGRHRLRGQGRPKAVAQRSQTLEAGEADPGTLSSAGLKDH